MEVWCAFNRLILPHSSKEFIRESLWANLKVGDRLKSWLPGQRHCCLCGEVQTVPHVLFNFKVVLLTGDIICKCFNTPVHQFSHDHLQTLSTPQGLLLWAARQANWSVRFCAFFQPVSQCFPLCQRRSHILQTWSELSELSVNMSEV